MHLFARQLAVMAGVSIVVQESIENSAVSLEVRDQDINDVIATVGRRLGTEVTRTGDLYFIGDLRPEDRGVYVTRVGELGPDDVSSIATLLLSDTGRAFVSQSGLAVVADKVEVLSRVSEAFEKIKDRVRDTWLVQFHIVETSAGHAEAIGAESVAAAGFSVEAFPGSGTAFASLNVALENIRDAGSSTLIAEPVYLVNDGEVVRYDRGQEVPVTTSTITADGNVQNSVAFRDVGSSIVANVRGLGGDKAVLTVSVTDQRLTEETISGQPIIDGYEFEDVVDVVSGGTYLLSTFDRQESSETERRGFSWLNLVNYDATVSQVWVRVYRVGSDGVDGPAINTIAGSEHRSGLSEERIEPVPVVNSFDWNQSVLDDLDLLVR